MGLVDFDLVGDIVVVGVEAFGGDPVEDGRFEGFGDLFAGVIVRFIKVDEKGDEELGFGGWSVRVDSTRGDSVGGGRIWISGGLVGSD